MPLHRAPEGSEQPDSGHSGTSQDLANLATTYILGLSRNYLDDFLGEQILLDSSLERSVASPMLLPSNRFFEDGLQTVVVDEILNHLG